MRVSTMEQLATCDAQTFRDTIRGKTKAFWYVAQRLTVLNTSPIEDRTTRIAVDAKAHFMCTGLVGSVRTSPGLLDVDFTVTAPPELRIVDESSSSEIFDKPIRFPAIIGNAQRPFPMNPPYLFKARTNIRVEWLSISGNTLSLQVAFQGYKLYLV